MEILYLYSSLSKLSIDIKKILENSEDSCRKKPTCTRNSKVTFVCVDNNEMRTFLKEQIIPCLDGRKRKIKNIPCMIIRTGEGLYDIIEGDRLLRFVESKNSRY